MLGTVPVGRNTGYLQEWDVNRQCLKPGKLEGFPGNPLRVLKDYFLQPPLNSKQGWGNAIQFNT